MASRQPSISTLICHKVEVRIGIWLLFRNDGIPSQRLSDRITGQQFIFVSPINGNFITLLEEFSVSPSNSEARKTVPP